MSTSSISPELQAAGDRTLARDQKDKKNYAEALSRALASKVANLLRAEFPGILPDELGRRQESRARTSKGFKKLDVNYSTPELGLGLGVSIKTLNFRDPKTKRYTKNYTRIDNELRAEAHDYHERQPYAVLVALVFLPVDACDDGLKQNPSSFGNAVYLFRDRAGRQRPTDSPGLFEAAFIGLYEPDGNLKGQVAFFDVMTNPPKQGRPRQGLIDFDQLVRAITSVYDRRNGSKRDWAE